MTDTFRKIRLFSFVAVSTVFCLISANAFAQGESAPADTSFSIQNFQPSPGPLNFFAVESPEIGDDMKPSVGMFLSYQHRPFVLLNCPDGDCDDGSDTINAVENFLTLDILGSFNFLKYFQVGLALPLTLWQHGEGFVDEGTHAAPGEEYDAFHIGDIRVHLKARILGKDEEDGPSLAFAVIPTLPIAEWAGISESDDVEEDGAYGYGGDGFLTVTAPKILFGYRYKALRVAANVGALWRQQSEMLSTQTGHALTYGVGIGYQIIPEIEVLADIYGNKSLTSDNFVDAESAPLLFLGGGRFTAKDFLFFVAAGGGVTSGIGVPQFQVVAGAAWAPRAEEEEEDFAINEWDIDGDGIDNEADECKESPEDMDGFQDEDGCPDRDNDKDGIADGYDSCPMEPEDLDKFRDDDGCPDRDHDEDGIEEADDKCPEQAEDFDEFEDADGCPEMDNDKDSIPDGDDFCPNQPEDIDKYQDEDGCPDLDNDADGVPDTKDQCPNEAETLNGYKDADGCPDRGKALVIVSEEKIELKEMIQFKTGSDLIKGKRSYEILDIVSSILTGNTAIRISVEGHTDNRGNAAKNRDLSKRRAESVKRYLAKQGVEDHRLETVGWGPDKPIENNKTRKGRAANRRVEFIIIQQQKQVIQPDEQAPEGEDMAPSDSEGGMDFTSDGEGGGKGGGGEGDGSGEMDFTAE